MTFIFARSKMEHMFEQNAQCPKIDGVFHMHMLTSMPPFVPNVIFIKVAPTHHRSIPFENSTDSRGGTINSESMIDEFVFS